MPKSGERFSRAQAEAAVKEIHSRMNGIPYTVCGSYRRNSPDVGDLDILAERSKTKVNLDGLNVEWSGDDKIGFELHGMHVDIKFVPKKSWGAGLLHHTGPWGFNIMLRTHAKRKGMILNEYGLFNRDTDEVVAQKTEEEILKQLLTPPKVAEYIDPTHRKTPDWVAAAKKK